MTLDIIQLNYGVKFLLTCLLRGMTRDCLLCPCVSKFLLTCLLRGMTPAQSGRAGRLSISTHMPLARHDNHGAGCRYRQGKFLLTCLLRGMTVKRNEKNRIIEFLLTCLLRGMTNILPDLQHCNVISTHMPLARHDYDLLNLNVLYQISTHMPLARHDVPARRIRFHPLNFYSHASCEA